MRSTSKTPPPQPAPAPADAPVHDPLYSLAQTCGYIGISQRTFLSWRQDGLFPPPVDLPGIKLAWRLSVLNAWIDAHQRPSQAG